MLFLSLLFCADPVSAQTPENVKNNYVIAYEEHVKEDKPMLVVVSARWCEPCRKMKNITLPKIFRKIRRHKLCYAEIDIDEEQELFYKLTSSAVVPEVIIFYKRDGKPMSARFKGNEETLIQMFLENLVGVTESQ